MAGRDGGKDRKGEEGEIAAGPEHVYSHISCLFGPCLVLEQSGLCCPAALLPIYCNTTLAYYTDTR